MGNRELSRRELLMTSTALATGATVMHPFDAFAQPSTAQGALIARAKSLELDTPYVPPPGDALEHHAAGFAKIMCSALFVTELEPDFAAENVGYFTAPYEVRHKVGKPLIDRAEKAVHVTLPNGVTRTAKYLGSQGCVALPVGQTSVNFTPVNVISRLPDPSIQLWPMGDVLSDEPLPPEIDATKLKQAVNAAFEPAGGMTAAFVVILARTPDRRTLRQWHHGADAARRLVHGQKPHRDVDGRSDQTGRLRHLAAGADPGMAKHRRSARQDSHRRHHAYVERAAHSRAAGSRLRPGGALPRSSLFVYRQRQFVPLRRHAAAAMAAQHDRPLPQHRSGLNQLSHSPRRGEARRRLFLVPAARAVRQDRHPHNGDGHRPLWEFSHAGLRARLRSRLGAPRQSLSPGRRLERRADSFRRLRQIREHACSCLESRQASDLRRLLLDQRRRPLPGAQGGVLHVGSGRAVDLDHSIA